MRTTTLLALTLCLGAAAHADFSYTTTRKTTGGMMASMAGAAGGPQTSKSYFKGQRMKTDSGSTATIIDFEAQTITTINPTKKTYTVKSFSDIGAAGKSADFEPKIDVKETGQRKTINGFNASELVMTMQVDSPQVQQMGQMQMEMDMWLSTDVPGYQELHDFYQRNMAKFPWTAMAGGATSGMQKAMADLQKKMASMHGVQVESVVRMKSAGGAAQMAQMQQGMASMCPQMQALIAQGGPTAAAIKQQYDRMCGGASASSGSSNALMEITSDSSDFSTASIPDSVFAIPAGFTKTEQ
ncbi:MAG: DUF4412 domain-containing protein [Bryobacteraceae bacterium]|jgi:hypothetical protein